MIGKTFGLYIALRFIKVLLAMFLGLGFLIVTIDFIEQLKRINNVDDVSIWSVYIISLLRAPVFIEKAFPFACLFAAMITLTQLNLKMELVVARAAGISALQFLWPIIFSAVLVGIFIATFYNPLAIRAHEFSEELIAEVIHKNPIPKNNLTIGDYWIKQQENNGGSSIINAEFARENGKLLDKVTFLRFNKRWQITERINAKQVIYKNGHWLLSIVTRIDSSGKKTSTNSLNLKTGLTEDELLSITTKPDSISFWRLKETAERLEKSGTNSKPYLVQYYSLAALPIYLVAMVVIAATVCLRFVRFGQIGRMVIGGIICGFVLYIITTLITSLGNNGIVSPMLAALSPGIVAILFGTSVLLHKEDG